jgi:ribonuclease P protein component
VGLSTGGPRGPYLQEREVVSADAPNRSVEEPAARGGTTFPRAARLLKHADFDRVYKQGRRHFSSHITVFYLRQAEGSARVGFTVGRVLGGAVDRNRIKRRLRDAVRQRRSVLQGAVDVVINPKKSVLKMEFAGLLDEVGRAFETIARKLVEK